MRESIHVPALGEKRGEVVIFHGLTSSPLEVSYLAKFLAARGYSCFCPLLPGHERTLEELKHCKSATWLEFVRETVSGVTGGKVFVIGLSLGALLALYSAQASEKVHKVVAISPPVKFRSQLREILLPILAMFPDFVLDHLWTVPKSKRNGNTFAFERESFERHSLAAGARLYQIRNKIIASSNRVGSETLVLFDPEDHHLVLDGYIQSIMPKARIVSLPGAQHEMVVGRRYQEVFEEIATFLER